MKRPGRRTRRSKPKKDLERKRGGAYIGAMRALAPLPAFLLLAAAACSRPVPDARVEYRSADESFSASLPGGWKVDDSPGLRTFKAKP